MGEMHCHPGKKLCGPKTLDRTLRCLCEKGEKEMPVTSYWIEKNCIEDGKRVDHNQAEECLEILDAQHYGQLCRGVVRDEDPRSAWELVRLAGPGKMWRIDPLTGKAYRDLHGDEILIYTLASLADGLAEGYVSHRRAPKQSRAEARHGVCLVLKRRGNLKLRLVRKRGLKLRRIVWT